MKTALRISTEIVFYFVLIMLVANLLCGLAGIAVPERWNRALLLMFFIGAPLSLVLSQLCLFMLPDSRYKWYVAISSY